MEITRTLRTAMYTFSKEVDGKELSIILDLNYLTGTMILRPNKIDRKDFIFAGTLESSKDWNYIIGLMEDAIEFGREKLAENQMF